MIGEIQDDLDRALMPNGVVSHEAVGRFIESLFAEAMTPDYELDAGGEAVIQLLLLSNIMTADVLDRFYQTVIDKAPKLKPAFRYSAFLLWDHIPYELAGTQNRNVIFRGNPRSARRNSGLRGKALIAAARAWQRPLPPGVTLITPTLSEAKSNPRFGRR